jgi:hypothetical protein
MADDIRVEDSGKQILVGLYPDNVLVLKSSEALAPTREKPLLLSQLSVMVSFPNPAKGDHAVEGSISGPDNNEIGKLARFTITTLEEGGTGNVILKLAQMRVTGFGIYTLQLTFDAKPYEFPFEVRKFRETANARKAVAQSGKK